MFRKSQREILLILKQELLTIHLLKFGKTNHMTQSVMSGVWVAFFMSLWLIIPHLKQSRWKNFTKRCAKEHILDFQSNIVKKWMILLIFVFVNHQKPVLLSTIFLSFNPCILIYRYFQTVKIIKKINQKICKEKDLSIYFKQSKCHMET